MMSLWSFLLMGALCVSATPNRIVGGDPTTIEQYPSIVQVEFLTVFIWSQSCAATIITQRHVLSAAHCFSGILFQVGSRRIRAGTTTRNNGGIVINIARVVNHPSYTGSLFNLDGDISVVELTAALFYNNAIQPAPIVSQDFVLPDNLPVMHAGWGATSQGGSASSVLRDVTIYTINQEVCRSRYSGLFDPPVTDNMICAGILDVGGKDACQGDSGGPLYYGHILVGVVSWGQGCASAMYPGVSTRVASYTNWVVSTAT